MNFALGSGVSIVLAAQWNPKCFCHHFEESVSSVMLFIPLFCEQAWKKNSLLLTIASHVSTSFWRNLAHIKRACVSLCVWHRFESAQILKPHLSRIGLTLHFSYFATWFSSIILFLCCVHLSESMLWAEIRPALLQNRKFYPSESHPFDSVCHFPQVLFLRLESRE